ncbi:MAG: NADH-quinone oxidoreductase subunit K [Conexivisphaerales archaeon]
MSFEQTILYVTGIALIMMGTFSIFASKNLIKSIISYQTVVFGVNLSLFASSLSFTGAQRLLGDTFVFISIVVGAAVEAAGLAIIITVFRKFKTLNPAEIRRLMH